MSSPVTQISEALEHLQAAERALGSGQISGAHQRAQAAIDCLQDVPKVERLQASAWMALGHAQREAGTEDGRREAIASYDRSLKYLESGTQRDEPAHRNQEANVWINRGLVQLELAPADALESFDRAIERRQGLPLEANPGFRWGLAAAWMNRADALTRLQSENWKAEAARSADEAIAQLKQLPLDENPAFRTRLAIAWMNRGLFVQDKASIEEAVQVLRQSPTPEHPEHRRTLACVCFNYGQLAAPDPVKAAEAARECLQKLEGDDARDVILGELGLNARHLLVRSLGALIEGEPGHPDAETRLAEATDTVEEALNLALLWDTRGFRRPRPIADELFGFGARLYRLIQPHFLAEFVMEFITPERMDAAQRELALAMARLKLDEEGLDDAARARRMQIWSELQATSLTLAQAP